VHSEGKDSEEDTAEKHHADLRTFAKQALLQLLEPLAGFVADSGLSTNDLIRIFREAAVRNAVQKQAEALERLNISGIAATTGISRSDVSQILKKNKSVKEKVVVGQQQSTNSILSAWHSDPRFTDTNGQPADLKIYGRGPTFHALAKKFGRGIPTRAVLDELLRAGAIELLENQKIRAKATVAVERGMSTQVIKAFGDRASELLSTMLLNMRKPDNPRFIANVSHSKTPFSALPLFRKELASKSADFLAEMQQALSRKPSMRSARRGDSKFGAVSITVFYHESRVGNDTTITSTNKRRNFRRTN